MFICLQTCQQKGNRMTLRTKAFLTIIVVMLSLIALLYITSQNTILSSFNKLEKDYSRQNVERVLTALSNELLDLRSEALDWSAWDDAYAFVEDANQDFLRTNLTEETFSRLELNLIVFIHSSGRVVFGEAFDLDKDKVLPVPPSLLQMLSGDSLLTTHADTRSRTSGIILLPESPMLIASYPILTSKNEGPIRGTLIMGRYLGSAKIEKLSEQTRSSIIIAGLSELPLPLAFEEMISSPLKENRILVEPLNNQTVAGYSLLRDIYGKPILVLRVDMPRDISGRGETAVMYFSLIVVVVGGAGLVVLLFLLDRQVLLRLSHIVRDIQAIGAAGDFSGRVTVHGEDELANLAYSVNDMVANLQRSQSSLIESEERYRTLLQLGTAAGEAVIMLQDTKEREGTQAYFNDSWCSITGYPREELSRLSFFDLLHPEYRDSARQIYRQKMLGQIIPGLYEFTLVRKDGKEVSIEVASAVTIYRGERIAVLYIRDITDRKKAQAELERLYQHEQVLRADLQEEIAKRGEFTRALVHELRTPLTPIVASSDLLAEELKNGPLYRLAKNIYEGAMNLNRRVEELLDLARGEIGLLYLNLLPIDPLRIIREVCSLVGPLVASGQQTLLMELPSSLPTILADEERLRQILLNLINNAVKFTPAGGKIILRAREEGEGIVVEVSDSGRGIDEEQLETLFQPYARLERDRERLGGLGLGLSLVKTLVKLHKGKIWVKSQVRVGSTFAFFLPKDPAKSSQEEKHHEDSAHRG